MTSSDVRTNEVAGRLFMWFAQPDREPATLLMVPVYRPETGPYLHPLISASLLDANDQAQLAEDAAESLGVTATLREYELVSVSDLAPARSAS